MHGLTNRAIECFIRDTYGHRAWDEIACCAGLGFDSFEAMLRYDDRLTEAVLAAAAQRLGKPRDVLLEDLGTYLISHPTTEAVRRLLRFGGVTFHDFLGSLEELPGRARLAVPDLDLPQIELVEHCEGAATLYCRSATPGFGWVLVGILRAMADDYGALALLEHLGGSEGVEIISLQVHEARFAEGRSFALARQAEGA
jgi:hypothetical protein